MLFMKTEKNPPNNSYSLPLHKFIVWTIIFSEYGERVLMIHLKYGQIPYRGEKVLFVVPNLS